MLLFLKNSGAVIIILVLSSGGSLLSPSLNVGTVTFMPEDIIMSQSRELDR